MTRIDAHRDVVSAQQDTQAQDHAQLRYATLHHGVCFAYGSNSPHGRLMRTLRLRRLQQLARLRAILLRRLGRGKAGAAEGEDGEGAAASRRADRMLPRRNEGRDEQRGGGNGSNRDSNDDSDDSERARPKPVRIKVLQAADRVRVARRKDDGGGGKGGSGTDSGNSGGRQSDGGETGTGLGSGNGQPQGNGERGRDQDSRLAQPFDTISATPAAPIGGSLADRVAQMETSGEDALHPDAFGAAWIDDLHALLDRLTNHSETDFYASILELNLSWLRVQERFGQPMSGGIARFVERAPSTQAGSSGPTRAPGVGVAATQPAPQDQPMRSPSGQEWAERLRSARLLAPLVCLNGMHPRPRAWLSTALAKLEGMQAHTLDRRSRAASREQAHEQTHEPGTVAGAEPGEDRGLA